MTRTISVQPKPKENSDSSQKNLSSIKVTNPNRLKDISDLKTILTKIAPKIGEGFSFDYLGENGAKKSRKITQTKEGSFSSVEDDEEVVTYNFFDDELTGKGGSFNEKGKIGNEELKKVLGSLKSALASSEKLKAEEEVAKQEADRVKSEQEAKAKKEAEDKAREDKAKAAKIKSAQEEQERKRVADKAREDEAKAAEAAAIKSEEEAKKAKVAAEERLAKVKELKEILEKIASKVRQDGFLHYQEKDNEGKGKKSRITKTEKSFSLGKDKLKIYDFSDDGDVRDGKGEAVTDKNLSSAIKKMSDVLERAKALEVEESAKKEAEARKKEAEARKKEEASENLFNQSRGDAAQNVEDAKKPSFRNYARQPVIRQISHLPTKAQTKQITDIFSSILLDRDRVETRGGIISKASVNNGTEFRYFSKSNGDKKEQKFAFDEAGNLNISDIDISSAIYDLEAFKRDLDSEATKIQKAFRDWRKSQVIDETSVTTTSEKPITPDEDPSKNLESQSLSKDSPRSNDESGSGSEEVEKNQNDNPSDKQGYKPKPLLSSGQNNSSLIVNLTMESEGQKPTDPDKKESVLEGDQGQQSTPKANEGLEEKKRLSDEGHVTYPSISSHGNSSSIVVGTVLEEAHDKESIETSENSLRNTKIKKLPEPLVFELKEHVFNIGAVRITREGIVSELNQLEKQASTPESQEERKQTKEMLEDFLKNRINEIQRNDAQNYKGQLEQEKRLLNTNKVARVLNKINQALEFSGNQASSGSWHKKSPEDKIKDMIDPNSKDSLKFKLPKGLILTDGDKSVLAMLCLKDEDRKTVFGDDLNNPKFDPKKISEDICKTIARTSHELSQNLKDDLKAYEFAPDKYLPSKLSEESKEKTLTLETPSPSIEGAKAFKLSLQKYQQRQ